MRPFLSFELIKKMESTTTTLPAYAKFSLISVGIVAFTYILYVGQGIIVPLIFATILSILLNPLVNFLTRKGVNRVLSIFLALLIALILASALFYFLGSQASLFSESFPMIKKKLAMLVKEGTHWYSINFNTSPKKINAWLAKLQSEGLSNSNVLIGQTLDTLSGLLIVIFLLPVYIFMILFYKPLLLDFIGQLFSREQHSTVKEVLAETKSLIQNYLIGLLIEASIVAALNSIALFALGIEYAILIGVLGALLNMIPYVGGLVAIALPLIIALATKPPIYLALVVGAYILVQFIDNNVIVPRIVASKVKINALTSIVVVLVGGTLWGIPGMFLSLPLTAIIKVIFDRTDDLKPLGFLLGDNMPSITSILKVKKSKSGK